MNKEELSGAIQREHRSKGILITGLLCCFTMLQFFLQGSLSIMSHEVKRDLNLDAASMSILSSAFFYSYILLQVPVGMLLDRFGMKKTCFLALILMGLSCFAFAATAQFYLACLFRVVMGVGASFGFIAMLRSIKLYFLSNRFILVMSIVEAIGMIGVASLNVFFSCIKDFSGWRSSIVISGLLSFLLAFLWSRLDLGDEVNEAHSHSGSLPSVSMLSIWRKVASYRLVWFNGLFAALLYSIITVFVALWGIPYTEKLYQISTTEAASLVSLIYIGLAVGSLCLFYVISILNIKLVLRFGTLAAIVFLACYIYFSPQDIKLAYLLLFLVGFSCSVYQLAFGIVAENVSKDVQSTAGGVTNMLCMAGAPILQPLIGFALTLSQGGVLDGYESYEASQYRSAFLVLMLCLAFAFWVSWFVFPNEKENKV